MKAEITCGIASRHAEKFAGYLRNGSLALNAIESAENVPFTKRSRGTTAGWTLSAPLTPFRRVTVSIALAGKRSSLVLAEEAVRLIGCELTGFTYDVESAERLKERAISCSLVTTYQNTVLLTDDLSTRSGPYQVIYQSGEHAIVLIGDWDLRHNTPPRGILTKIALFSNTNIVSFCQIHIVCADELPFNTVIAANALKRIWIR